MCVWVYFAALGRNKGQEYNILLLQLILRLFKVHVPIESFTHNLLFFKQIGLHCQTPTLIPVCQAGRQFVPFYDGLWYYLVGARNHDLLHESPITLEWVRVFQVGGCVYVDYFLKYK